MAVLETLPLFALYGRNSRETGAPRLVWIGRSAAANLCGAQGGGIGWRYAEPPRGLRVRRGGSAVCTGCGCFDVLRRRGSAALRLRSLSRHGGRAEGRAS